MLVLIYNRCLLHSFQYVFFNNMQIELCITQKVVKHSKKNKNFKQFSWADCAKNIKTTSTNHWQLCLRIKGALNFQLFVSSAQLHCVAHRVKRFNFQNADNQKQLPNSGKIRRSPLRTGHFQIKPVFSGRLRRSPGQLGSKGPLNVIIYLQFVSKLFERLRMFWELIFY